MNNDLLFSSRNGQWDSPKDLMLNLGTEFKWDLDVCANEPNICQNFYSPVVDGLKQKWNGLCWMNPPYGRGIYQWIRKARLEATRTNTTLICLVPARTDTKWWQDWMYFSNFHIQIKGRLTFGSDAYWQYLWDTPMIDGKKNTLYGKYGKKNNAPFPSALIVFGDVTKAQDNLLSSYGLRCTIN